ncbi:hypothetical protein [Micromonospora sp. NPDC048830]|uniref:hypothetical protein n=1 Tax=Micromonospora sp. NPDC048830 TaxID=3364257 RepID=UPI0037101731
MSTQQVRRAQQHRRIRPDRPFRLCAVLIDDRAEQRVQPDLRQPLTAAPAGGHRRGQAQLPKPFDQARRVGERGFGVNAVAARQGRGVVSQHDAEVEHDRVEPFDGQADLRRSGLTGVTAGHQVAIAGRAGSRVMPSKSHETSHTEHGAAFGRDAPPAERLPKLIP